MFVALFRGTAKLTSGQQSRAVHVLRSEPYTIRGRQTRGFDVNPMRTGCVRNADCSGAHLKRNNHAMSRGASAKW